MGHFNPYPTSEMVIPLILVALLPFCQANHFFGPPAIGFGVGLVSVYRRFPVATSIVSRRSSRSYSHQTLFQATPAGVTASSTTTSPHLGDTDGEGLPIMKQETEELPNLWRL